MAERRGLMAVLSAGVAVLVVLVAMAGAWVLVDDGDSNAEPAPSASTEEPSDPPDDTTTTTEGSEAGGDPEVESAVAEISAFVEEERGLTFLEPVDVELADDDEFEQRLLDDFEEEDEPEVRDTEDIFQALGVLDADVDLVEQLRGLVSAGVVGFYDPETDELVVRGTELTPYTRQTIAHELTHALDDQHFELFREELEDAEDESSFGFSSIVEGNATVVEDAFEEQLSDEEQEELLAEESAIGAGTDFSQFPEILLALLGAPYELGQPLVSTILDEGGQERLDEAFEEPPTTTEQVLHPELFLAGEEAVAVPEPQAGGEVFDEGMFGELFLGLVLSDSLPVSIEAQEAGDGWGGDHYVAWREDDGRTCLRSTFVMDTPEDLEELSAALSDWAADQADARVNANGERVTLTSCA